MTSNPLLSVLLLTCSFVMSEAAMAQCGTSDSTSADTARGTVFVDDNGDGTQNQGESGLPGVSVSNWLRGGADRCRRALRDSLAGIADPVHQPAQRLQRGCR